MFTKLLLTPGAEERDTMWLWSLKRSSLEVIEEEPASEMEKPNKEGDQKNMDGTNTDGNDNENEVNMDETKRYEDCNDETDSESSITEEEKEDKDENKAGQKYVGRKEVEERKKRRGNKKLPLCVTFSEGGLGNSHQSESADGTIIGVLVEEEEEEDGTGEPVWRKWKEAFRWNDFFYGLIFGLGPTSWDVLSDLKFGWSLATSGDLSSAGLCYLFVTIPGVFFLQEVIMLHIFNNCSAKVNTMVYVATGVVATTAMAVGFGFQPLLFQYPAIILGFSLIGVKLVGVFVHTPEMKAFSVRISAFEYTTESNLQLCLLFFLWLQLEKKDIPMILT